MIISRTPLRMSFVGGGSDLPVFYRRYGGAVVSTAINQFVYLTLNKKFDEKIRVSYSKTEEASSAGRVKHPLVREGLKLVGLEGGLEITSIADIPARGTGLGSSSSFTVGLLHALHAYQGRTPTSEQLAQEACVIELERCAEPIGKQDQYAAAYGGLNFIEFCPDDTVRVEPIRCAPKTLARVEARTLVFYTGITRSASLILQQQQAVVASERRKQRVLMRMVELARRLRDELSADRAESFGEIIHEGWMLKRGVSAGITSQEIERWYAKARRAGAVGGKLLGAGTGGFMMFHAPPERHDAIAKALAPLRRMAFKFEPDGSRIIFVHG